MIKYKNIHITRTNPRVKSGEAAQMFSSPFRCVRTIITSGLGRSTAWNSYAAEQTGQNVEQPQRASKFLLKCCFHTMSRTSDCSKKSKLTGIFHPAADVQLRKRTKSVMLFHFVSYDAWIRVSWIIGPVGWSDTKWYCCWGSNFPLIVRRLGVLYFAFSNLETSQSSLYRTRKMFLPFRDKDWCCGSRSIEMWLANCALRGSESRPIQSRTKRNSRLAWHYGFTAAQKIFPTETHWMFCSSKDQKSCLGSFVGSMLVRHFAIFFNLSAPPAYPTARLLTRPHKTTRAKGGLAGDWVIQSRFRPNAFI